MSSIGPQLPPHLTKRKRTPESEEEESNGEKHPRRESPPTKNEDEIDLGASDSDSDDMGPRMPSAAAAGPDAKFPISTTGSAPASESASSSEDGDGGGDDDDDDDDDDFGPSLPSASTPRPIAGPTLPSQPAQDTPQRDEWMLAPPPSSTTFSERDTTRIRARKFASKPSSTSSSAAAGGGGSAPPSIWTETPEEKLRRLQDSVLGRAGPTGPASAAEEKQRVKEERDSRLAAGIDAQRGRSLYEEHQKQRRTNPEKQSGGNKTRNAGKEQQEGEDDDPSKRAFDREKDMALGGKISASQRRELINKSANFGGRFAKGSFL